MAKGSFIVPILPINIDFEVNSVVEGIVANTMATGVVLLDTGLNPIVPVSITQLSNQFEIVIATGSIVPALIEINTVPFKSVNPGDTLDIAILNSALVPIGTPNAPANKVDIGDSTVLIQKSDSTLIFSFDIAAEDLDSYNVADSAIRLEDSAAVLISNTNVKATDPATITAPDGVVTITDSAAATLYVVNVKSDGTATQAIGDSTVVNNAGVATYTQTIVAQGTLVLPQTTYNVFLDGVLDQTFSIDTLKDETINIEI